MRRVLLRSYTQSSKPCSQTDCTVHGLPSPVLRTVKDLCGHCPLEVYRGKVTRMCLLSQFNYGCCRRRAFRQHPLVDAPLNPSHANKRLFGKTVLFFHRVSFPLLILQLSGDSYPKSKNVHQVLINQSMKASFSTLHSLSYTCSSSSLLNFKMYLHTYVCPVVRFLHSYLYHLPLRVP